MTFRWRLVGLAGLLILAGIGFKPVTAVAAPDLIFESPLKSAPQRIMTSKGPIHPNATPLELNPRIMAQLKSARSGDRIQLEGLLLEPGLKLDLEVEKIDPFTPNAKIVIMNKDRKGGVKENQVPLPDMQVLVGRVVGDPDSKVILGLSETGCHGYITSSEGIHLLSSPLDGEGASVIYGIGEEAGRVPVRLRPSANMDTPASKVSEPARERRQSQVSSDPPVFERAAPFIRDQVARPDEGRDSGDSRSAALTQGACCVPNVESTIGIDQFGRYTDWRCETVQEDTSDPDRPVSAEDVCALIGGIFKPEYGPGACQEIIFQNSNCTALHSGDTPGSCCLRGSEFAAGEDDYCIQSYLAECESLNGVFIASGFGLSCVESNNCSVYEEFTECTTIKVAVDTDIDFLNLFNGNVIKAVNYVAFIVGASSQVYTDEIGVRLKLTEIRVWATGTSPWDEGAPVIFGGVNSPYDAPGSGDNFDNDTLQWLLLQLANWNQCADCESPDIIQLFSGGSFATGDNVLTAGLCFGSRASSVINGLNGAFPYPLADFRPENFDLLTYLRTMTLLVQGPFDLDAISIRRTQCLSIDPSFPVFIDYCKDCSGPGLFCLLPENFPPTIMSSCYECPGGVSNMSLKFHPWVRGQLYQWFSFAQACAGGNNPVTTVDDIAFAVPGLPVFVDVLENDSPEFCPTDPDGDAPDQLQIAGSTEPGNAFPVTTPLSGEVIFLDYNDVDSSVPSKDRLIYQSPCDLFEGTICPVGNPMLDWPLNPQLPDYTDSFGYRARLQGSTNTNASLVRVQVSPPPYDWPSVCISGQNCNESGAVSANNNITGFPAGSFVMNMNITVPLDGNSNPIPVDILSMSFLNLYAVESVGNDNATDLPSPTLAGFELWVDGNRVENYTNQLTGNVVYLFSPFRVPADPLQPYVGTESCGGWSFIDPDTLEPRLSTTTGDIFLRLVWEGGVPPGDYSWRDGRVYLQLDSDWPTSEWNAPGACCVPVAGANYCVIVNGSAVQTAAAECVLQGGVFLGPGTECGLTDVGNGQLQNYCSPNFPVSLGACCIPGALVAGECECAVTTQPQCELNNGLFFEYTQDAPLGYNKLCFPQTCNTNITSPGVCNNNATEEGACCYELALNVQACDVMTYSACMLLPNSYYAGDAVPCLDYICIDNNPPPTEGACCLIASGACFLRSRQECEDVPGFPDSIRFLGEGSDCSECIPPGDVAKCCIGRHYCRDMEYADCVSVEGRFERFASCATTDCFIGSCCVDGDCLDDVFEPNCLTLGGTWIGPDANTNGTTSPYCDSQPCIEVVPTVGLCCVEQVCYMVTQIECLGLGGYSPNIPGLSCESGFCLQGGCCLGQFPVITDRQGCDAITDPLAPLPLFTYGLYPDDPNFTSCSGCPWDVNNDGTTDVNDLISLLGLFGSTGGQGDVNYDGIVDIQDLLDILANWAVGC